MPDLPGGYCTADCTTNPCSDGQTCFPIGGASLCLKNCGGASDCRDGYQCFGGVCQPNCNSDGDCGTGFMCTNGQCTPYPGAPLGAQCGGDMDCSSRDCVLGVCVQSCNRDGACPDGQTCALNAIGDGAVSPTTHIAPACTARRATAAPGAPCTADGDCDRGACQLGICVELCATTPDCHGPNMTCNKMWAILDNDDNAPFSGCLPTTGTLAFSDDNVFLPVPSQTQSFAIFTALPTFDFSNIVGIASLTDPTGAAVYTPPNTTADFYAEAERFEPTESTATMLVPNSPARVSIIPGVYGVMTFAQKPVLTDTTMFIKLGPGPIMSGNINLNFYLTDLSSACKVLTTSNAPTTLSAAVDSIKQILSQANLTITNVTWTQTSAPNVVRYQNNPTGAPLPDLDDTLMAATANQSTTPGLDVVIVRSIVDQNSMPSNVLGIAGGIPGSPILGTPHSGAIVSLETFCQGQTGAALFGTTASHELSHTMGLFHNVEQDGHTDPLTDTQIDPMANLMYWLETSGMHLSVQQGQVIRNDPKVQ